MVAWACITHFVIHKQFIVCIQSSLDFKKKYFIFA